MFEDNNKGPLELLERYQQYEYILSVDKKALHKELLGGEEKAPLELLREKVAHYDKACFEIRNLSNDIEDFNLFRVMAASMKTNLSRQAEKIRDKLLEGI
jgi:hypothetical protein